MKKQSNEELLQKYFTPEEIKSLINFFEEKREEKIKTISLSKTEIVLENEKGTKYILEKSQGQFREKKPQAPNMPKASKPKQFKKAKSRKGKIISPNAKIILAPLAAFIVLIVIPGFRKKDEPTYYSATPNNQMESLLEQATTIPKKIQDREVVISIHSEVPILEEKMNLEPSMLIQETFVEVSQKENMSKRLETDTLLGPTIDYYATRYGIPNAIGRSLITQERPIDSFENVAQLTRKVCDEKMCIPIIEKTPEDIALGREIDKIYIVRDMPLEGNFETPEDYQQALIQYQEQLKTAIELEKEGYQILKYEEVIQNQNSCIQISMAYLIHCVYKCNENVNQGIRGYNGGYTLSKKATDEVIANGLLDKGDPFYNAKVFSYLYEEELDTIFWKVKNVTTLSEEELKNAEIITIKLQFNNVRNAKDEKETGHYL